MTYEQYGNLIGLFLQDSYYPPLAFLHIPTKGIIVQYDLPPGGAGSEAWNRVYMIAPGKKFGRARLSTILGENKYGGHQVTCDHTHPPYI